MPDFSARSRQTETMDDLQCSGAVVDRTLRELDTINALLGGNHVTISGMARLLRNRPKDEPLQVADLGCGSGDMLRRIRKWGDARGWRFRLTGIDANPNIISYARKYALPPEAFHFETLNIFSGEFANRKFDVVTATLFFHHFDDEQLVAFFSLLKDRTKIGIVINDLHRHWFAYYSIKWLTRFFSGSHMVKNDAPVSVLRAFRRKELVNILEKAGIRNYTIRWMWAFRWQVVISFL